MTTFTTTVELFVDEAWLDITDIDDDTHVIDEVTITRGRSDQQEEVPPTSVTFSYLDNNALLDGENPLSTYYRKIGIGTELRVTVDSDVRAVVEIVSWEPTWERNADGVDVTTVQVEAAGVLRRLDDAAKPLSSPAYRAITAAENDADRVAYWPLEEDGDADDADIFSPDGNAPPGIAGTINFGGYTDGFSTPRMYTFADSAGLLFFKIPDYGSPSEHKVVSLWTLPETSLAANTVLMRLYCVGGNVDFIDLVYRSVLDGDLSLKAYRAGSLLDTANLANYSPYILDQHFAIAIELEEFGSDTLTSVTITNMDPSISEVETTDTFTGVSIGQIGFITVAQSDCSGASFGQLLVGSALDAFSNWLDINVVSGAYGTRGFLNDSIDRINRIADEESIPITIQGDTATGRLAKQTIDTAMDIIRDAVFANQGLMFEDREDLALLFRTRVNLYNQDQTSFDYVHLSAGFKPVTDDKILNNVTAQRDAGGTAKFAIPDDDTQHWTTQEPPDGARDRNTEVSFAVSDDSQLPLLAAWYAHLNSWREKRFKVVTFELAREEFTSGDRTSARALDIGDVFLVDTTGSSPYIPGNEVRFMVQGYTETASKLQHTIAFNTTPADSYEVEVVDTTSVLANVVDADDTSVKLAISDDGPPWSTTDEPYYIQVDGDAMKVTTITTDTPALVATGAASYGDNASIAPALPAGITPNVGQLLVIFAGIRLTGAQAVGAAPTGWTKVLDDQDIALFAKYYVTGDVAPTVTFSGGAAGDTTGAQMAAFSGLSMNLDKNSYTGSFPNGWKNSVNASAANIAYPAYLNRRTNSAMLILGKKQDDWTSVATIAGTSEIGDSSSLTGSDMGLVWDLYNPGTPTTVAAGSFTVTGGASATSEGVVLGLRPLQTATVVRGTNGVATSHTAGAAVRAWRSGVNAL